MRSFPRTKEMPRSETRIHADVKINLIRVDVLQAAFCNIKKTKHFISFFFILLAIFNSCKLVTFLLRMAFGIENRTKSNLICASAKAEVYFNVYTLRQCATTFMIFGMKSLCFWKIDRKT